MTIFTSDECSPEDLDWAILRDGGVSLYRRPDFLAEDTAWLQRKNYRVVSFSTDAWKSEDQMHVELRDKLQFPSYYGRNLDALDECICQELLVPDIGGLALVFLHYDEFAKIPRNSRPDNMTLAQVVADVFARAVRYHMLFGRRLLILIQSENPNIQLGRLGGLAPIWNRREWLNESRGL